MPKLHRPSRTILHQVAASDGPPPPPRPPRALRRPRRPRRKPIEPIERAVIPLRAPDPVEHASRLDRPCRTRAEALAQWGRISYWWALPTRDLAALAPGTARFLPHRGSP